MLLFSAVATSSFSSIHGEWEDIQHHQGAHKRPSLSNLEAFLPYSCTSSTTIC